MFLIGFVSFYFLFRSFTKDFAIKKYDAVQTPPNFTITKFTKKSFKNIEVLADG